MAVLPKRENEDVMQTVHLACVATPSTNSLETHCYVQ